MRVQSIGNCVLNKSITKLKMAAINSANAVQTNPAADTVNISKVSANQFLSQMPNVSFGKYKDDLTPYTEYNGSENPPKIEKDKFAISQKVEADIEKGDYLSAIGGKINLALICRGQGKERDAFMLEEGIKALFTEIPDKQGRETARALLAGYNAKMAESLK